MTKIRSVPDNPAGPSAPRRPRDAAATRQGIVAAARTVFSQHGYDTAGVREIAGTAGVNQALVNRYFGSKENLFAAAIIEAFSIMPLLDADRARLAQVIARYVLLKEQKTDDFNPTLAIVRSLGSDDAAGLIREGLEERFIAPLAAWMQGEDRSVRAALVVSILAGITLMRDVLALDALQGQDETLAGMLEDLLAVLIDRPA